LVPRPLGVPCEQQQYQALTAENGVLMSDGQQAALATAIRAALRPIR
jgi:hypothetical protein